MEMTEKLKGLYKEREQIRSQLNKIEEEDQAYKYNKYHWEYDKVHGGEWKSLQDKLSLITRIIILYEESLGIGLFMTPRGLCLVTLKEEE